MDVGYFLKRRTAFIRQFYKTASFPFVERKQKIEAEEEPFIPPYSEDGVPAYLDEWIEAEESLHVLAYSCISMLSAALHLYLKTWEKQFRIPVGDSFKLEFKKGWINGYKVYFELHKSIRFEEAPVDLTILQELALARNRIQHPEDIFTHKHRYSHDDIGKLRHPYFVDPREETVYKDIDESNKGWLFPPTLHVTGEKLFSVIVEVEKFVDWLEKEIAHALRPRRST